MENVSLTFSELTRRARISEICDARSSKEFMLMRDVFSLFSYVFSPLLSTLFPMSVYTYVCLSAPFIICVQEYLIKAVTKLHVTLTLCRCYARASQKHFDERIVDIGRSAKVSTDFVIERSDNFVKNNLFVPSSTVARDNRKFIGDGIHARNSLTPIDLVVFFYKNLQLFFFFCVIVLQKCIIFQII